MKFKFTVKGVLLWIVTTLGLGVLLGYLLIEFNFRLPDSFLGFLLQFALAGLAAVVCHELGHASVSAILGFRLLAFGIGPFQLHRKGSSWRIAWMPTSRLLGYTIVDPVNSLDLRRRLIGHAAGGPAANAVFGIAAAVLFSRIAGVWPNWLAAECGLFSFWSFVLCVVCLIPLRTQNVLSDGARLRTFLHGGADSERLCCLAVLLPVILRGTRPREWSAELVHTLFALTDESSDDLSTLTLCYNWLLDMDRKVEAAGFLERILKRELPAQAQGVWRLEAAWFEARFRGDLARAREWREAASSTPSSLETRCFQAKAEAAIALLENRGAEAENFASEALRECERLGTNGMVLALREELDALLAEVAAAKQSAS
jgi:hypothetical protein